MHYSPNLDPTGRCSLATNASDRSSFNPSAGWLHRRRRQVRALSTFQRVSLQATLVLAAERAFDRAATASIAQHAARASERGANNDETQARAQPQSIEYLPLDYVPTKYPPTEYIADLAAAVHSLCLVATARIAPALRKALLPPCAPPPAEVLCATLASRLLAEVNLHPPDSISAPRSAQMLSSLHKIERDLAAIRFPDASGALCGPSCAWPRT
eukprot:2069140-Pleurochrysis_carterae.AAC.1